MARPNDRQDKAPKRTDGTKMPPEGPHARDDLTDEEKTPGTGSLPDRRGGEADVGPD